MRPTIPLAEWRLAIDLAATRAIDVLTTPPARTCDCVDCQRWAASYRSVLPASLREELARIGIDPARPVDVYATGTTDCGVAMRVSYFAVGRILSGPAEFKESEAGSAGRHYVTLRPAPALVGVAVAYQERLGAPPSWATEAMQPLLAIDLWVDVPATSPRGIAPGRHQMRQAAV